MPRVELSGSTEARNVMGQPDFHRFFRHSLALAFFSALFVNVIQSQTPPDQQQAPPSDTSVVKSVDEVVVDFVARNKKKPVLDLKPQDMVVTDDGANVKLSDLHLVTGLAGSNHLVTLLFDPLDPSSATNAREVAAKILKQFPAQGFSFAVFNIDRRLRLLQESTPDRDAVQKAISAATAEESPKRSEPAAIAEKRLIAAVQSAGMPQSPASAANLEILQSTLAALSESQRIIQDQHTEAPLAGLLALVRTQAKIPGRKLVIYFTGGSPVNSDRADTARTIVAAANRAEVSIYVINQTAIDSKVMEGLLETAAVGQVAATNHFSPMFPSATQTNAAASPSGPGLAASFPNTLTRMEGEGLAGNQDPLSALGPSTGGAYLFSEDNLKKPFRQAVADLTTYYEASYVPSELVYDGKFHAISVKTVQPKTKVQARAGYFAVPRTGGVRPFEIPLMKVFSDSQWPTDVGFHSSVLRLGNLPTGNENTLVVEVPISSLETRKNANANLLSWHVSIVSQVKDKSGAVLQHFSEDIPGHGALEGKENDGATMQRHFILPPGQYTLETVVADRLSGKVGTERTQFDVPSSASGPFLSDVALVRRIDAESDELDPFEPLRYQHGRVVPSLAAQLLPDSKNTSFFFLVTPDSSIADPALLEMQVLRNGELLGQVPLQLPKDLGQAFPYVASLKTDSLSAGEYDVRLSLAQGDKIIERERAFTIAGPQLANASLNGAPVSPNAAPPNTTDSTGGDAEVLKTRREPLVITALPPDAVAHPSQEDMDAVIAGARTQAVNYSHKLPNFLCVEVTDRSVDSAGNGRWHRKDSFGELLRYADNQETRTTLEVNGQRSQMKRSDMNQGPISVGEFGDLLNLVFQPESKAEFHWKETDALANGTVQVFEYRVDPKNNSMRLTDDRKQVNAGFHGVAYIDSATMGVRRISMEADDLPADFSIHGASISVDYDYVSVGTHDYLMPVRGSIRVKRGKREVDLNQIVFQDYRRYASQVKVIVKP